MTDITKAREEIKTLLPVPQVIYSNDLICGEYIIAINEALRKVSDLEKQLKEAKEIASKVLLDKLSATGQTNFSFKGVGKFIPVTTTRLGFPSEEDGGRSKASEWIKTCIDKGVISVDDALYLQQARLVNDAVSGLIDAVKEYNEQQILNGSSDLIPPSPFTEFTQTTLRVQKAK